MAVPEPNRRPTAGIAGSANALLRVIVTTVLVLILCGGVSYLVVDWRLGQEGQSATAEVAALKQDLETRMASVEQRLGAFEKLVGAYDPAVPLDQQASAALLTLAKDLETLKTDQAKLVTDTNDRLKGLEDSLAKAQGLSSEAATALTGSVQLKTLLLKAQSELITAKVELAAQNRGRAREEVELALTTLTTAKGLAGTDAAATIDEVIASVTQARTDLSTGATTGGDLVQLALHRLGALMPTLGK